MHEGSDQSAQDLLESIFKIALALVGGERATLMLRDTNDTDFIIAKARGLAEDVRQHVRVREGEGIAGRVIASRRTLLGRADRAAGIEGRYRSDSFVSVPILVRDRTEGVLNIADRADGGEFTSADVETLELLANHIAACLVRQRVEGHLRQLAELAETDPLTELFNRRHFDRRIAVELERARRAGDPVSLLLIDVNAFKEINDRLGHAVGDEVIRHVADGIRRSIRAYDVPVRYGGDEFAVILPSAEPGTARRVGERIVGTVAGSIPRHVVEAAPNVGVSIGIATAPPVTDVRTLIDRADAAMYQVKGEGGGVAAWQEDPAATTAKTRRGRALPAPYLSNPGRLADAELQALVPNSVAEEWNVLVIGHEGRVLTVVMPEPSNAATEAVSSATGYAIYPVYSDAADIERARRGLTQS